MFEWWATEERGWNQKSGNCACVDSLWTESICLYPRATPCSESPCDISVFPARQLWLLTLTLPSSAGKSTSSLVGQQKQAPHPQAVAEVGHSHLGLGVWWLSCLQGHMGRGSQTLEVTSALPTIYLHPAPEDPLGQLLHVLQDLREAHSSSLASPAPREPHHFLELQT